MADIRRSITEMFAAGGESDRKKLMGVSRADWDRWGKQLELNQQRERERIAELQANPEGMKSSEDLILEMLPGVDGEMKDKIKAKLVGKRGGCIGYSARQLRSMAQMAAEDKVRRTLALAEPWRGPIG